MSETVREAKLLQYLNEAYGKERELETALEAHIAMTTRKPYLKRLRKHLTETKGHGRQVERRIKRISGDGPARVHDGSTNEDVLAGAPAKRLSIASAMFRASAAGTRVTMDCAISRRTWARPISGACVSASATRATRSSRSRKSSTTC